MNRLPDHILYLINCYAGEKHSIEILEDIQYKYVDKKIDTFDKISEDFMLYRYYVDDLISFSDYLTIIMKKEEKNEYLYHFSNCNCCLRHSVSGKIRKKKKQCSTHFTSNNKICDCKCRHFRRFIERSFII